MKNLGFSVLAAMVLFVCTVGYTAPADTGGNRTKLSTQICECSNVAVNTTTPDKTKPNTTTPDKTKPNTTTPDITEDTTPSPV